MSSRFRDLRFIVRRRRVFLLLHFAVDNMELNRKDDMMGKDTET
jgi:hypothetical protein